MSRGKGPTPPPTSTLHPRCPLSDFIWLLTPQVSGPQSALSDNVMLALQIFVSRLKENRI